MSKRANPFHTAQKSLNKAKRLYAEQNKKDDDLGTYHLTDYYYRDGLRFVHPYYYTFKSFVKKRWVGEKLKDIYVKEFRGESEETLMKRFAAGNIAVNGEPVRDDYVIKDNDFIEATMHRHEMPVKADQVSVLHDGDKFYVVNKPASIPVHPAGRFRYNSLSFILGKTLGMKKLSTVHRLDRLTSGCQIFAKDSDTARKCFDALKSRKVSKLYVTGLQGMFPEKEINCDAPIGPICSRIGINAVSQSRGQNSVTTFNRIHYDQLKDLSIVVCKPLTGRTHQIRVHAQYLGHPVINDPLYGTKAWGEVKGKDIDELDERSQLEITDKLRAEHDNTCGMEWRNKNKFIKRSSTSETSNESSKADEKTHFDPICEECGVDFEDPPLSQLEIYLHAYRYEILDQMFVAPLPHWAKKYEALVEEFVKTSVVSDFKSEKADSLNGASNEAQNEKAPNIAASETVDCMESKS